MGAPFFRHRQVSKAVRVFEGSISIYFVTQPRSSMNHWSNDDAIHPSELSLTEMVQMCHKWSLTLSHIYRPKKGMAGSMMRKRQGDVGPHCLRTHQAIARRCHYKRRLAAPT